MLRGPLALESLGLDFSQSRGIRTGLKAIVLLRFFPNVLNLPPRALLHG